MLLHRLELADRSAPAPSAPMMQAMRWGIGARTTSPPPNRAQADDTIPTTSARCIRASPRRMHARRELRPAFSAPTRRAPPRTRNAGFVQPNIDHARAAAQEACGSGRRTHRVPAVSPGIRPASGIRRCIGPRTETSGRSVGSCESGSRMASGERAIGEFGALFEVQLSHLASAGSVFCTGTHRWNHDAR